MAHPRSALQWPIRYLQMGNPSSTRGRITDSLVRQSEWYVFRRIGGHPFRWVAVLHSHSNWLSSYVDSMKRWCVAGKSSVVDLLESRRLELQKPYQLRRRTHQVLGRNFDLHSVSCQHIQGFGQQGRKSVMIRVDGDSSTRQARSPQLAGCTDRWSPAVSTASVWHN